MMIVSVSVKCIKRSCIQRICVIIVYVNVRYIYLKYSKNCTYMKSNDSVIKWDENLLGH